MAYYPMQDIGPGAQGAGAPPSNDAGPAQDNRPQAQQGSGYASGSRYDGGDDQGPQRQAVAAQALYGRGTSGAGTAKQAAQPKAQAAQAAQPEPKKHLFSGISPVQAIATALAALTSMLLSAQIGITGSIIGVFVGSIVSTVSAQVYKNMASLSAKKIQEKHDEHTGDASKDGPSIVVEEAISAEETTVIGTDAQGRAAGEQKTTVIQGAATTVPDHDQAVNHTDAYAKHAVRKARAQRDAKAQTQKRVVIVSVVSALIAILLTAGIINLTTAGQGIGTKARVSEAITQAQSANDAQNTASNGAASNNSVSSEQNQKGTVTYDDSNDQGATGSSSGSSSSTGSTGSSSASGQQSSGSTGSGSSSSTSDSGSSSGKSGNSSASNGSSSRSNDGSSSNGSSSSSNSSSNSSSSNTGSGSSSSGQSGSSSSSGSSASNSSSAQ